MNKNPASALSANKLKILAIILMFLDHFAGIFLPIDTFIYLALKTIGRIAAPVFCFLIAEGFHYTSNIKRYFFRLFILALVSHFPYNLAFYDSFFPYTSVIWALLMGLAALAVIKSGTHIIIKLAVLAACCALSYTANWNFVAVLWIAGFGLFHGDIKKQIISFCVTGIAFHLTPVFLRFFLNDGAYLHWHQLGIFLAVPVLLLYNGRLGIKSKVLSWSFHVFYPAHLFLLYLINRFTPLAEIIKNLF